MNIMLDKIPFDEIKIGMRCHHLTMKKTGTLIGFRKSYNKFGQPDDDGYINIEWDCGGKYSNTIFNDGLAWAGKHISILDYTPKGKEKIMEIKPSKYPPIILHRACGMIYLYDGDLPPISYNIPIETDPFDVIFKSYIETTKYPQNGWIWCYASYSRIYVNVLDAQKTKPSSPSTKFNVGDMVYITKAGINSNKFRIKSIETIHMCGEYHNQYYFSENNSRQTFIGWEENLTLWTSSW